MPAFDIRPATEADAASAAAAFPDLLPDRWRPGGNRRSLVAVAGDLVLGHARGIDNEIHPGSRVLVLEAAPGPDQVETAIALARAQLALSERPLRMKVRESQHLERAVARALGGVAVQACPPWRYTVDAELRSWASAHRSTAEHPRGSDAVELLDLMVGHYLAQHARWSPADETALREAFAADAEPGGYDERSVILRRDGHLAAAAMVWADDEPEVGLLTARHDDPAGRADMESCLAAVIDASPDGAHLLIDSHVTEPVESQMLRDLPGPGPDGGPWLAIVALPSRGGPAPIPMPAGLLPPEAAWIDEELGW